MKRLSKTKVVRFLQSHGLKCAHLGPETPTYSGEAVNLDVMHRANSNRERWPRGFPKPPDLEVGRILHELGHALVVSPKRLKLENFGLGTDHIGPPARCSLPLTWETKRSEEVMATVLMIALSAVLADSEDRIRSEVWAAVSELQRRGLLVDHAPSPELLEPLRRRNSRSPGASPGPFSALRGASRGA